MREGFQVDAAQLHRHATNLQAVRDQLGAIRGASRAIAQDDAAYGLLCGWISAILERRHQATEELFAAIEENLELAAEAIAATGTDYEATDNAVRGRITEVGGRLS